MKRKRTPLNRKRVLSDPAFELSRQNSAEFSRACRANRLLRQALLLGLRNKADRYISGRLTQTMFKILQSDPINGRGERRVPAGVLSILEGFNFNRDTSLQNVLKAPYSIIIDQAAMRVIINFPSFIPQAMIHTTSGANAFVLTAMAASVHFEEDSFPVEPVQTDIMDISLQRYENLVLQLSVVENQPDHTIVVALGIEFFHETQGIYKPVDKKHNALTIVKLF